MTEEQKRRQARQTTQTLAAEAAAKWARAPMHIKAMAGEYVGPVIAAVLAVNEELREVFQDEFPT